MWPRRDKRQRVAGVGDTSASRFMRAQFNSFLRIVTVQTCLGVVGGALLVSACSGDKASESTEVAGGVGRVSLPLTAIGGSGAVYRLRQATFDVFNLDGGPGTVLFSESDPLASTLESTLPSGNYSVALQNGWFLEKAVGGSVTTVAATLLSPSVQGVAVQVNGESSLLFVFETNGEVIELGQGQLVIDIAVNENGGGGGSGGGGGGPSSFNALIETNTQALQNFTLRNALDAAIINAGLPSNADAAYHAIIDSYAPAFQGQDPSAAHCDDQFAEFGGPGLNGYPLQCGRLESQQFNNLDTWFPIAAVNRLDLAPSDGSNCGQQRLVFANNDFIGNGRMLMIIESQIPNPNPGCGVDACLPIAQFWSSVEAQPDPFQRASMLSNAFVGGGIGSGFGAFINANQLGPNGGQVRTNNFNDSPWTLREFHFGLGPAGNPRPVPVGDSPHGALWNDFSPLSAGPSCRSAFLGSLGGLLTNNVSAMSFSVPQQCKDSESRNDFSEDYVSHLNAGGGAFINDLNNQLSGTGLSAQDIAARARFAGSCIGCHQESSGAPLGAGVTAPFQFDFVHVSERIITPCDDGNGQCFGISDALRNQFLPHRGQVLQSFLDNSPGCGGPVPFALSGESPPSGIQLQPAALEAGPTLTLGGQLAGPHAH